MGGGEALQRLSGPENCLLGMVAGCGSKLINYPLLVVKIKRQQGLPVEWHPTKLYRGLPMAMVNLGGTTACQFGLTGFFQKLLSQWTSDEKTVTMCGSFLGGLASGIPCSVWELTMVQQTRHGGSMLATPMRIYRDHGLQNGLFRGMAMTLGRESVFTLSMLGITPTIQTELVNRSGLSSNTALAVGALSGACIAATLTHPMDTIKTVLQGDVEQVKYKNNMQAYSVLIAENNGFKGLFRGLDWRIGLISTTFFLVNSIKQHIAPVMFPPPKQE